MNLKQYEGKIMTESPSATGNWLQFTIENVTKGYAEISLVIRPEMTNPYQNIHGGMMACIIDESIGWAVLSLESEMNYTTLNLSVDFLYAAHLGEQIIAKSRVVRHGKKVVNVNCEVFNVQGEILAKASSNLINTSMQRERIEDRQAI